MKHNIISTSICLITALGLGITAGFFINKFFLGPAYAANYSSLNEADYESDYQSYLTDYNKRKNSATNLTHVFNPVEMVNIAFARYTEHESTCSFSYGVVDAGITKQIVRAAAIKNNGRYFEESTSRGMVSVGTRTYQNDDEIKLVRATSVSDDAEVCTWDEAGTTTYNRETYIKDFGKTPETPIIFLIHDKTIIHEHCSSEKTDIGYKVELTFNTTKSVLKYVRQMKSISDLYDYPTFYELSAVFELDDELMIKHMKTNEYYYAQIKAGSGSIGSTSRGILDVYYYTDVVVDIPSTTEGVNYSLGRAE